MQATLTTQTALHMQFCKDIKRLTSPSRQKIKWQIIQAPWEKSGGADHHSGITTKAVQPEINCGADQHHSESLKLKRCNEEIFHHNQFRPRSTLLDNSSVVSLRDLTFWNAGWDEKGVCGF